jgi:hypothetical protein
MKSENWMLYFILIVLALGVGIFGEWLRVESWKWLGWIQ